MQHTSGSHLELSETASPSTTVPVGPATVSNCREEGGSRTQQIGETESSRNSLAERLLRPNVGGQLLGILGSS